MRVLLVASGYPFEADGNFGDTHLVALGSYLRAHTAATVRLVDLDYEQHLDAPRPEQVFDDDYGVVGISCYSSFDYLKSFYLGVEIRRRNPGALLVVGGYHPSARPDDFLGAESPFDHVVVGEGERPLARIVDAALRGERIEERVLGPDPVEDLDALPLLDWSLLDRYRARARHIGGQLTLALSRGCPFHCAFCMEGAKGNRGWRAYSPARAERELNRLHAWLDLSGWTVFLTDPVFGLRRQWRGEVLERIERLALPVDKYWALCRADVLEPDDLVRFHRARFGLGFGLESGDPGMLAIAQKAGETGDRPAAYLRRFEALAEKALGIGFPWGANVIAGHPGETPDSLIRSARWCGELFGRHARTSGFLSVDPYRFYPGSPIDRELESYEARFGTRVHRQRWWNYSEPSFTASWVNPSRELDWRTLQRLTLEHYGPVVRQIHRRFSCEGTGSDYFRRSTAEQVELMSGAAQLESIRDYCLWRRLTGQGDEDARRDPEAQAILRQERERAVAALEPTYPLTPALRAALVDEPRERYGQEDHLWESSQDIALPLPTEGASTLSALHAYAKNYRLLALDRGDRLLELGGGTGYGAAVAARLVGTEGRVRSVELDAGLAERAVRNLAALAQVEVVTGPAVSCTGFDKVVFCFAQREVDAAFVDALPVEGRLLAPLVDEDGRQELTLWVRTTEGVRVSTHGEVFYGADRSGAPSAVR